MRRNRWKTFAGVSGCMAVIMGAVGSHVIADAYLSNLVQKAAFYQLIFAVALLWTSGASPSANPIAKLLFLMGTVLFCGSIYVKVLAGWPHATMVAPAGGICFMLGWLAIAFL
jgi:uncharacterized membrane protein YgdD (TMEM256/DUF423 family)